MGNAQNNIQQPAKPRAKHTDNPFMSNGAHKTPELDGYTELLAVLDGVFYNGCAILLSHTADGGALVLTVLDGPARHKTYITSEAEMDLMIEALREAYPAPKQ